MRTDEIGNRTMQGCLFQTNKIGNENHIVNRKNIATTYVVFKNNGNRITLQRECDILEPKYLVFRFKDSNILNNVASINEILDGIIISYCATDTNNNEDIQIYTVKLRFLLNLENYEIIDDELYVNLHFTTFLDEINLIGLRLMPVSYVLRGTNDVFSSISILAKATFLDNQERINVARSLITFIMQSTYSMEINNINTNILVQKLKFLGISKGLFIECDNVSNISNITLTLDNKYDRIFYNKFLIKKLCIKITDKLLYVPLNPETNWKERTKESFDGAINFSRIENVILRIDFNDVVSRVTLYSLYGNGYRQNQGFLNLEYIHDVTQFIINNNPEENNKNVCPTCKNIWPNNEEYVDLTFVHLK